MTDVPAGFRIVHVPGFPGALLLNERALQEITCRCPVLSDPYSGRISAQLMREYAFGGAFLPNSFAIVRSAPDPNPLLPAPTSDPADRTP